jgi:hypothetical protein
MVATKEEAEKIRDRVQILKRIALFLSSEMESVKRADPLLRVANASFVEGIKLMECWLRANE